MSIHELDFTGQPAYFPGFASAPVSEEPFFVEIEEPPKAPPPPAADAGQRPAWLPSPKKQAQTQTEAQQAPRKPTPPVQGRSAKRSQAPPNRGGMPVPVIVAPQKPEEELPWTEQARLWLQGEGGKGLGVSAAVHIVLLLILSLVVLSVPKQDEALITTVDQTEFADIASVEDVEIVGLDVDEVPQVNDPRFEPNLGFGTANSAMNLDSMGVGLNTSAGSLVGSGKGGGLDIKIPSQAVTRGSFTVWTVPEDPTPGEKYMIMIQIKLNNSVKRYPRSDLSGNVVGTDGYRDNFGGPTESGYLPINKNTVIYEALPVPGAAQLVKDVITVESKILKEKQVIELIF